jgi:LysM repeat protein
VFGQEKTHTIKKGETLSSIAKKHKTTIAELIRLNPEAEKGISAGAILKVEGGPKSRQEDEKPKEGDRNTKRHLVKPGESLFKISKKYKVQVSDLEKWNRISNKDLKSGVEIWVSEPEEMGNSQMPDPKENAENQDEKNTELEPGLKIHKVSSGETLSKIAKKYGMDLNKLKSINKLKSNQVNLGQELKVLDGLEARAIVQVPVSLKEKPGLQDEKPRTVPNKLPEEKPSPSQTKMREGEEVLPQNPSPRLEARKEEEKPIATEEPKNPGTGLREVNNTLGYTRVIETGFAEAIEGDQSSKKHLCMHKSAPVGTILQVKNEANGQVVFVKVIGRLPETGSNEKLIIRISKIAYDRLMAVGKRFPVEVSYPESQP